MHINESSVPWNKVHTLRKQCGCIGLSRQALCVPKQQLGNLGSQYWKELQTEEASSQSGTRGYLKNQAIKVYILS